MINQNAVSLQIPIIPEQVDALVQLLNTGGNPAKAGTFFPFEKLSEVHFARWIIAPAAKDFKASLIYAANVDGNEDDHLANVTAQLSAGLDQVLVHCIDYPVAAERTAATRLAYLKKHSLYTAGFYTGAPTRTVQQIKQERELHSALRDYVRDNGKKWVTEQDSYNAIKNFLDDDPKWDWAKQKNKLIKKSILKSIPLVLLLLALLPILIIWIILIHFIYERNAKPFGKTTNDIPLEHLAAMKSQEDIIYQNQLSQVFETKGGIRRMWLKLILWATSSLGRTFYNEGQLMGTPTIHFARWVLIDGGDRFVFFSNFDGSYDEYLGDFVDNNGWGLNAIYGAAKGYPTTLFVFAKGSYKILDFLGWGRITQVSTPMWYSAYPWDGLQQIIDRSKLRYELFNAKPLNKKKVSAMLKRI